MKRSRHLTLAILLAASHAPGALAQHDHHSPAKAARGPQEGQHSAPRKADRDAHTAHHKMATGVKLDVRDDAAAQVITMRLGPLNLPARTGHMDAAQAPDSYWQIPFDGWLTAYHPRLTDDAGNTIPGRLLHHVAYWNASRSDFLCPNKEEHIFGAGGEMNDWPALPGFGYRVGKGERIRINTMFHNPTGTSYPKTYIEVKVEYRLAAAGAPLLRSVYPTWFDVQKCGDSGYDLKPGVNVTTGEFTLGHAGILLGVGGHLHDYGEQLALVNTTREEPVATLNAQLDPAGRILSMPIVTFVERGAPTSRGGGYRLAQGEQVRVTATYNNRSGQALPDGAMGIVVGYFLPDDDTRMAAFRRHKTRKTASR